MNSARSTSTVGDGEGHESKVSSQNRFTHSVFQPVSARSSSTVDDDELRIAIPDVHHMQPKSMSKRDELNLSRTSLHGENMFDISQSRAGEKAQKLNSIANNMTSQARSPSTKTSLLGMENSYQNIKHKTPVNQVRQSPQVTTASLTSARSHTQDDFSPTNRPNSSATDSKKLRNLAATKIQRCYRRHLSRNKSDATAVKKLLEAKREQLSSNVDYSLEAQRKTEDNRRKTREERARLARQHAIEVILRVANFFLDSSLFRCQK